MSTVVKVKGSALAADKITPLLLLGYEMDRPSGSAITDIPGRAKAVVTYRPQRARKGSLAFLLADEAAATAFDALLSRPVTFTLSDTDRGIVGMDFAVDTGGFKVQLDPDTRALFLGTVQVVEQ